MDNVQDIVAEDYSMEDIFKLCDTENPHKKTAYRIRQSMKDAIATMALEQFIPDPIRDEYIAGDQKIIHSKFCICCADSRENTPVDNGEAGYFRHPGGFGTNPDGTLNDDTKILHERAAKEGVPVFETRQHSGCGAMAAIYAYYSLGEEAGRQFLIDNFDESFIEMAIERRGLYEDVHRIVFNHGKNKEPDFSYFEKRYGIPLDGMMDDKKFQACMAMHQGEIDFKASAKECHQLGDITTPMFIYNHMAHNGRRYILTEVGKPMALLPLPTEADYENKLLGVAKFFPAQTWSEIRVESIAQQEWAAKNDETKFVKQSDNREKQAPTTGVVSSTNALGDPPTIKAPEAGDVFHLKTVAGIAFDANGRASTYLRRYLGLLRHYRGKSKESPGVNVIQFRQMSGGELIDAIYNLNVGTKAANALIESTEPLLVGKALEFTHLYNRVLKNTKNDDGLSLKSDVFSHYKNLGIPLPDMKDANDKETYAANFKKCIATEIGLANYRVTKRIYDHDVTQKMNALGVSEDKELNVYPEPILFFMMDNGQRLVLCGKAERFLPLPKVDHSDFIAVPDRGSLKSVVREITRLGR